MSRPSRSCRPPWPAAIRYDDRPCPRHVSPDAHAVYPRHLQQHSGSVAHRSLDDVGPFFCGAGMTNASYGNVPYGIWNAGRRRWQAVTIANLTIGDFYFHVDIIFNAGTQRPLIHNVHLNRFRGAIIKSNPDGQGGGVDSGVLQYSTIEFTNRGRDDYPKGIDIHTATGWHVRHNLFRNLRAPGTTQLIGPAVLGGMARVRTTVEGNTFINACGDHVRRERPHARRTHRRCHSQQHDLPRSWNLQ